MLCIALSALDILMEVAMLPHQHVFEDDVCPVRDELLGELYSASKVGLPVLIATVTPDLRAQLALFCYHRSHLHTIGLAIAASCNEDDLVQLGGTVGASLYARSREAPSPAPVASHYTNRRKITLATGSSRDMPAFEEVDDEISEPAPPAYAL
jgi:hypothetical protein